MNTDKYVPFMKKGIVYFIYLNEKPIKQEDKEELLRVKKEGCIFLTKMAICECGTIKESKRMVTPTCIKCTKRKSRKNLDIKEKRKRQYLLKAHGKQSHGNSIWL